MDVRAVDPSSLAAKRLELDKTRPVTEKAHAEMHEQFKTRETDDATKKGKHPNHSPEDQREESETLEEGYNEETIDYDAERTHPDDQGTSHDDHHILDVRV
jgi:hypothetical protein